MNLTRRLARLEASNKSAPIYVVCVPSDQIDDEARVLETIAENQARTKFATPFILLPRRMTFEEWLATYGPRDLADCFKPARLIGLMTAHRAVVFVPTRPPFLGPDSNAL